MHVIYLQVQRWRTGASIAWTMLVFPLFVYAYLLLATVSMIHPYQWIIGKTFISSGAIYMLNQTDNIHKDGEDEEAVQVQISL